MKTGTIVILAIIVIGALVIGLDRMDVIGGTSVPNEVLLRPQEVINVETLELTTVTTGDWEQKFKVDTATGYKIDGEGQKLAVPMTCHACGEKIPPAPMPGNIDDPEQHERIMMEYRCPKCGGRAYPPMM